MLIDFETMDIRIDGQMKGRTIVNGGVLVADNKFNPIHKKNVIIESIYNLPAKYIVNSFYLERVRQTEGRQDTVFMPKFRHFYFYLRELCEELQVDYDVELWSFNADFDYTAFIWNANYSRFTRDYKFEEFLDDKWFCIQNLASNIVCNTPVYKRYILKRGFATQGGNYPTSAELVYRYITCQDEFIEEHTGLSDCHIELEILKYCKSKKKKMYKTRGSGLWRIANPCTYQQGNKAKGIPYKGHIFHEKATQTLPVGVEHFEYVVGLQL